MEIEKVQQGNLEELMKTFDLLPIEAKAATLDNIIKMSAKLREFRAKAEALIIQEMEIDRASKMQFIDSDGHERTATLSSGKIECKEKNIDIVYEKAGFIPLEIGDYVFKPSWSKAKEAMKFGGVKKDIIEKVFVTGKKSIKID